MEWISYLKFICFDIRYVYNTEVGSNILRAYVIYFEPYGMEETYAAKIICA